MAPCTLENSYPSSRRDNAIRSGQKGLASQSKGRVGYGPVGGDFSGHTQPRGGATWCLHFILSLQARLGSSRAKQLLWCGASSGRQGGHPNLTAAGRGLAPAASEEEAAAKVTGTGLSDFFQPWGNVYSWPRGHSNPEAGPQGGNHLPHFHSKVEPGGPQGSSPKGRTETTSASASRKPWPMGGAYFIWSIQCFSEI